jgi:hypothetical protein
MNYKLRHMVKLRDHACEVLVSNELRSSDFTVFEVTVTSNQFLTIYF